MAIKNLGLELPETLVPASSVQGAWEDKISKEREERKLESANDIRVPPSRYPWDQLSGEGWSLQLTES